MDWGWCAIYAIRSMPRRRAASGGAREICVVWIAWGSPARSRGSAFGVRSGSSRSRRGCGLVRGIAGSCRNPPRTTPHVAGSQVNKVRASGPVRLSTVARRPEKYINRIFSRDLSHNDRHIRSAAHTTPDHVTYCDIVIDGTVVTTQAGTYPGVKSSIKLKLCLIDDAMASIIAARHGA